MILISPTARALRNGRPNPKNYPFWSQVIELIDQPITQVSVTGDTPLVPDTRFDLDLTQLTHLINQCHTWIAVDSFFQHFAWSLNKPGIVLWGQSDPLIFGHNSNINLLRDRSHLRSNQFLTWEEAEYRTDCWVEPQQVIEALAQFQK